MPAGPYRGRRVFLLLLVLPILLAVAACRGGPPPAIVEPATGGPPAADSVPKPGAAAGDPAGTAPPPPSSAPGAQPAAGQPGRDCLATLASVHATGAAAAGPPGVAGDLHGPAPITVLVHRAAGRWGVRVGEGGGLRLEVDLPLAVHRIDADGGGALAEAPACLLLVAAPDQPAETEHRVIDRERVTSAYASRTVREPSPAHEAAKTRARRAEERLDRVRAPRLISSGDPLLDVIGSLVVGVLGTVQTRGAERELAEAQAALDLTPDRTERPVYREYAFERLTVRTSKRAVLPVVLLDRDRNLAWSTHLALNNDREFRIHKGLDSRDRDLAEHRANGHTERDLESWERRPPEVRLSTLVGRFLAAAPAPRPPADAVGPVMPSLDGAGGSVPVAADERRQEALRGAEEAIGGGGAEPQLLGPQPPADPRFRSVVHIAAAEGRAGSGFYVTPELVLTNEHVVGDANVVDVTLLDGATVLCLVARRDPGRDLALVQVPKPGPPLTFYGEGGGAPPLEPGSPVEAIGHPRGPDLSPTRGIVTAVRRAPSPNAAGLQDVLFIQTDAPLNRGNSGGPLLHGGRVVGVSTWAVAEQNGGLNVAVHYQEALAFLAEAGLAF